MHLKSRQLRKSNSYLLSKFTFENKTWYTSEFLRYHCYHSIFWYQLLKRISSNCFYVVSLLFLCWLMMQGYGYLRSRMNESGKRCMLHNIDVWLPKSFYPGRNWFILLAHNNNAIDQNIDVSTFDILSVKGNAILNFKLSGVFEMIDLSVSICGCDLGETFLFSGFFLDGQ